MKNAIRAVMYVLVIVVSAVTTNGLLTHASNKPYENESDVVVEVEDTKIIASEYARDYVEVMQCSRNTVEAQSKVSSVPVIEVEVLTLDRELQTIPNISMRARGTYVNTDPVCVDAERLYDAYKAEYEIPGWDKYGKMNLITTLWDFLVEQQGVEEHNAAGIIGGVMCEGVVSQYEGSSTVFKDIDDARSCLGVGECGYGIAQWTYDKRQDALLKYYEMTNQIYAEDFEKAAVVAECCMLFEEIKAYGIFDDLYSPTTIEDAVGRMSVTYEKYDGCYDQWSNASGLYQLVSNSGSGKTRLAYAENIYKYFVGE